jgi:exopolyphosphatase/guanosine-5'-triphosphate,3'-diphosphate pyrophosphatase
MTGAGASRRVATIDVGTNTALLLVAEQGLEGLQVCATEDRFVRLGAGVDETRTIRPEAMARLRDALLAFRETAARWRVEAIVLAATSASRDARNAGELVDFVRRTTGLAYEILSGEEEARWGFAGALSDVLPGAGTVVTLDIGGGSTERVVGAWDEAAGLWRAVEAVSVDVGSVRVAERFFATQPPAPDAVVSAEGWIREWIDAGRFIAPAGATWFGASGTTNTLALLDHGVSRWSDLPDPCPVVSLDAVVRWRARLLGLTFAEVLALDPAVLTGRADVFPAGVLILDTVLRHAGVSSFQATSRGLRHGLALRYWSAHAR